MADIQTVIDTLQDAKVNDLGHIWITDEARCAMVRILMKSAELLKEQQKQIEALKQVDDALTDRIIDMQDEQPQIVRCKDCKHGTTCFGHFISCEIFEVARKPDFYCADVEKRSD